MSDPLSTLLAAIPGLASAGTAIATAAGEKERNAQLIEFQKAIINANALIASVQQQNAALVRDKHDLEEQIVRMKHWETEKQRYALVSIWDGTVAYALKERMSQGEPPHWLCANCFQGGKKSILNPIEVTKGWFGVHCIGCNAKIQGPWSNAAAPEYAHD